MSKRMLIDAAHAEETRVVVLDGSRVEEFDFESRAKKQLRGNIYLAKVTRVEPSLQAAFVEYGGNRHGFLAFNEIHPDYYQIPHADREALMRELDEDDDDDHLPTASGDGEEAENVGGEDDDDEVDEAQARLRRRMMRRYKIQEVIKRRQIMLVQVVKEERGNKGAALTTYLSLAGRYGVLMPNTDRGGGISRKITAVTDRKRLRTIVQDLKVPKGMGLIVRTAGAKRTKAEIKRDYEYLMRAWENIRDTTLHSVAPALIYEEEDLVKRAIRDLFDKDIEGVWVEGEAGYREARDFMRMLMPSQAKKIQAYREPVPLFVRHRVEDHLSQIYSPVVPLKSGGYLVINQTEALVAVDVNSGRSTRERNIEATALKTNMEAAEEAARQLRLRDLAGLIVIDFIDMDEAKNNRAVEKKLKDCLKDDRARVQMGKISGFGLMEISRQRRRTGILEGTTQVCPHCQGAGRVRSVESSALSALRAVEMEALRGGGELSIRVPREVALYILNHKREDLIRILQTHGLQVNVVIDDALAHADHELDRLSSTPFEPVQAWAPPAPPAEPTADDLEDEAFEDEDEEVEDEEEEEEVSTAARSDEEDEDDGESASGSDDGERRRGRGRRRRRGRRGDEPREAAAAPAPVERRPAASEDEESESERRRRRRGRRGGRRAREEGGARPQDTYGWSWPARLVGDDPYQWRGPVEPGPRPAPAVAPARAEAVQPAPASLAPAATAPAPAPEAAEPVALAGSPQPEVDDVWVELPAPEEVAEKPKRVRASRGRGRGKAVAEDAVTEAVAEAAPEPAVAEAVAEPAAAPVAEAPVAEAAVAEEPVVLTPAPEPVVATPVAIAEPPAPAEPDPAEITTPAAQPRRGWWRRGA
ncbi:Rne/Rng family ribonuclease [Caulobacter sp. KR2-114]|uniref:Rne/Rng family ribonuclease n=1 Tax=Caulobacter sp. KR2-114 TaxID=3400912 RepID=UPI003C03EC4C